MKMVFRVESRTKLYLIKNPMKVTSLVGGRLMEAMTTQCPDALPDLDGEISSVAHRSPVPLGSFHPF